MFNSVRARLTLWYTGVLALVLIIFAVAAYLFLARTLNQRTNNSLAEAADSFAAFFAVEYAEAEGGATSETAAVEAAREFPFKDQRFIIYDAAHTLVAASPPTTAPAQHSDLAVQPPAPVTNIPDTLLEDAARQGRAYATLTGEGRRGLTRAFARSVSVGERTYILVALRSLDDVTGIMEQARGALLITVPLALLIASLGGYFLARKSLAPVVAMSNKAIRIGAANLHERLPVHNEHDELGKLAGVFNNLLARLHDSFEQQRRFMADASHELRTPVAIVQGESEVALSQDQRQPEDYRESLAIVHDEGRRLTRIVEDLFTLARADAGQHPLVMVEIYLDELASEAVRAIRALAAKRRLTLQCDVPDEMPFRGDEVLLQRMFLNLLDNAIKHTGVDGQIRLRGRRVRDEYVFEVADTGCGIPTESQAHIFERFFRDDKSRSRASMNDEAEVPLNGGSASSGAGLGLPIARWIAEAHHGRLALQHSDKTGSTFVVRLPAT